MIYLYYLNLVIFFEFFKECLSFKIEGVVFLKYNCIRYIYCGVGYKIFLLIIEICKMFEYEIF